MENLFFNYFKGTAHSSHCIIREQNNTLQTSFGFVFGGFSGEFSLSLSNKKKKIQCNSYKRIFPLDLVTPGQSIGVLIPLVVRRVPFVM